MWKLQSPGERCDIGQESSAPSGTATGPAVIQLYDIAITRSNVRPYSRADKTVSYATPTYSSSTPGTAEICTCAVMWTMATILTGDGAAATRRRPSVPYVPLFVYLPSASTVLGTANAFGLCALARTLTAPRRDLSSAISRGFVSLHALTR